MSVGSHDWHLSCTADDEGGRDKWGERDAGSRAKARHSDEIDMKAVWVLTFAWLAMGCTSSRTAGVVVPIPAGAGTTYHLILGFGVVRVNDANPTAAVVTDAQSFGLVVSDRPGVKLGLGYASSSVVSVPADAKDVRVEVSRQPWGPLRVEVPAAELGGGEPSKPDGNE